MQEYKNCYNPVLGSDLCIPDPEAHVMPDGRLYVYGSLDTQADGYCSKQYHVISSVNMVDWVNHGVSFESSQVGWPLDKGTPKYPIVDWDFSNPSPYLSNIFNSIPVVKHLITKRLLGFVSRHLDIRKFVKVKDMLFAPDATYRNGKYYLYFCMSDHSEGVAVADNPWGPFANPKQLSCAGIDPAVFVDDDGQAYYFWGQFRASGAKLKDNMTELDESTITHRIVTEEEHGFHEGSSIRKRGDIYYFVYPSIFSGRATALSYATSKHPLGPYKYQGVIVDNLASDPNAWNIHGSIEEFNGQWYVFYHRPSGNSRYRRRLCIEPINFDNEGMIAQVPMTSQGAGKPFKMGEKIEGFRVCEVSGGCYVDGSELVVQKSGSAAIIRYVEWSSDATKVNISATGDGKIDIYLDGVLAGNVIIQKGLMTESKFSGTVGKHEIELRFQAEEEMNLNFIQIT